MKKKIIAAILLIGAILILIFQRGLYTPAGSSAPPVEPENKQEAQSDDTPKVLKTNPATGGTILATQTIEVVFNQPIENSGELKNRIEPTADFKIELSEDRKTARFIPQKPLTLGTEYRVSISTETKFDNKKKLDGEFNFNFKTISYRGV